MTRLTYHPACLLFPQLGKQELQELAEDIRQNGLQNDIVLLNGQILDGRNRHLACKIAGVEPRFVEWDGQGSPTEWVISQNLYRRHLTSSQRAVIASDVLPLLEREAKQRQRRSPGRGKKVRKKFRTFSSNGTASEVAARLTKTNDNYVKAVKTIGKQAPELIEKVRNGTLTVPDAKRLVPLPKSKRAKVLAMLNGRAKNIPILISKVQHQCRADSARRFKAIQVYDSIRLVHCRFQQLERQAGLKPQSATLVLTDIPYDKGFLGQLEDLALLAKRVLKPKGALALVCGQYHLPTVIATFARHLTWRWQGILVSQTDANLIYPLGITSRVKPILFFSNGGWQTRGRWSDVFEDDGKEKKWHPHQQSVETMENLIDYLSHPGDLVIDPCGGSFTTAVACHRKGRRFIGCDIDAGCVAIGRKRLAEETQQSRRKSA